MLLNSALWWAQLPILRLDPRYAMVVATVIGALTSSLLAAWRQRRLAAQEKLETFQRSINDGIEARRREARRAQVRDLVERRLLSAYEHTSRSHLSGTGEDEPAP
jgi:type II secretory pathway pseudopilin PulG